MKGFGPWIEELRRRKVFRTGAIYGAIALALAEGADALLGPLGLGEGAQRVIAISAILGFPVALLLAWLYDLGPSGLRRADGVAGTPDAASRARSRTLAVIEGALLLAVVGVGAWLLPRSGVWTSPGDGKPGASATSQATADATSVAVLPFDNLSADAENAYFADGLAEQLLERLSRIDGLRVASRASAFALRDSAWSVVQIGEALDVANVVEGSVQRDAGRVRITVHVADAADGSTRWAEVYDESMADIFAVQDSVASRIVGAMLGRIVGVQENVAGTVSEGAFEAYLEGIAELRARSPASLRRARRLFEAAIEADSGYAKAYAGLAQALYNLANHDATVSAIEYGRRAKETARRAIELDPGSAEAHAVLGGVLYQIDLDFAAAEREFERAIVLNPNNARAYQFLGESLIVQGRGDEAIEYIDLAIALDPLSPMTRQVRSGVDIWARRIDRGRRNTEAIVERFPDFWWGHAELTFDRLALGDAEGARNAWRDASRAYHPDELDRAEVMARAMDVLLASKENPNLMADARETWRGLPNAIIPPFFRMEGLLQLGDMEGAVAELRSMRDRRDPMFAWSGWALALVEPSPDLAPYLAILEESGIPPALP